jgi:DNA-binding IclR family transcriptional regulator
MVDTPGSTNSDKYFLASLARGLAVLEFFGDHEGGATLKELSEATGLEMTAAFRIAHTLEKTSFLSRNPTSKRYQLGHKVGQLGGAYLQDLDVRRVALPHIKRLVEEVRENVSLAALSGVDAVVIERIEAQQTLSVRGRVGWTFPVYSTSLGKALLASLPEDEAMAILEGMDRPQITPNTITALPALKRELAKVREQGFALNDEESAPGIRAVAAPIHDALGEVAAAINIGGPSMRITPEDLGDRLAARAVEAASTISGELGYRAPAPAARRA